MVSMFAWHCVASLYPRSSPESRSEPAVPPMRYALDTDETQILLEDILVKSLWSPHPGLLRREACRPRAGQLRRCQVQPPSPQLNPAGPRFALNSWRTLPLNPGRRCCLNPWRNLPLNPGRRSRLNPWRNLPLNPQPSPMLNPRSFRGLRPHQQERSHQANSPRGLFAWKIMTTLSNMLWSWELLDCIWHALKSYIATSCSLDMDCRLCQR